MTSTTMARDQAKAEARERLPEILAEVIPDFHPGRPFRCLNPSHEDKHPSMRYLPRTQTVRCFSCGWRGDVFDVVAVTHGLGKGEAFKRTFKMLGIHVGGGLMRPRKLVKPKAEPGTWAEIVKLIYPDGRDAPKEITLPLSLQVSEQAEVGLMGRILIDPAYAVVCLKCGLEGWHFEDGIIGELYDALCCGDPLDDFNPEFLNWLEGLAAPGRTVRKLAQFIIANGQRRMLDGVFAKTFSSFQNQERPGAVLVELLAGAIEATGKRYAFPAGLDDDAAGALVADLFRRFHNGEDSVRIMSGMIGGAA